MAFNQHNLQQSHRFPSNLQTPQAAAAAAAALSTSGSQLVDSEWILFSPNASLASESLVSQDDASHSYGDVLSSTEDRASYHASIVSDEVLLFDEEDRRLRLQQQDDEEYDSDDLIENLSGVVDEAQSESDDLNTRIEKWRKQQITDILKDIDQVTGRKPMSREKMELIQSWGIDDTLFDINNTSKAMSSKDSSSAASRTFYGSDLLEKYSSDDLRIIRKVVHRLSKSLKTEVNLSVKEQRFARHRKTSFSGHYSSYWRNMNALNREEVIQSRPPSPVDPAITPTLSNYQLEKYLPIFLKNLIHSNFSDGDQTPTASTVNLQNDNFWNSDRKSSSLLTISTNSIILNNA